MMRRWLTLALCWLPFVAAQDSFSSDLQSAFEQLPAAGMELTFARGQLDVSSGGHIQGIQILHDAAQRRCLAFLSHDSRDHAYVVVAAFPETFDSPGEVVHIHRFENGPLRHAGGIQIVNNILVIGLEDNRRKDRSEVRFLDVSDLTNWKTLDHLTIQRNGVPKAYTAGAVALAFTNDGLVAAVANWDSRAIDFYLSLTSSWADVSCTMEFVGRWQEATADRSRWLPDSTYGSYQAMNLFASPDGQLQLFGFCQTGRNEIADLFHVKLSTPRSINMHKVASRSFELPPGQHFKYGGGAGQPTGKLWLFSTERYLSETVRIGLIRSGNR